MPQDFHDLTVWQKAIDLTVCIYTLTQRFPKEEMYGLVSQLRRASVSVASNIAEGRGAPESSGIQAFPRHCFGIDFRGSNAVDRRAKIEFGKRESDRRSSRIGRSGIEDAYVVDSKARLAVQGPGAKS